MQQSDAVRQAMLDFYERLSAGDVASFDRLVSVGPATLVIGTAPGEWVTEPERLRYGFETEGFRIEPGSPTGWAEGALGWVVDTPTFVFPDGSPLRTRLTAVLERVDGRWKLVHMHVSVGAPDEEVLELQRRWRRVRRAVFVGGSSGIGLAAARRAVTAGWDVVVASRDPARADVDAEKVALDVTDRDAVRDVFRRLGPIDHLVSSTVARAGGPARELDLELARHAFETKLWGPFAAVQAADVRESIVLCSGVAAWTPMPGGAATAAVNGAVEALVRTLAVELAPVRVNAVSPGIVDTPTWAGLPAEQRDGLFARLAGGLPAGRVGRPEDVADAIWHLLENGFVTGSVLHVDGGHRLAAP